MVQKLDIHGVHFDLDENLKKYITRKINKLEKYISPDIRESIHVEVYVEETKTHREKQFECEVVWHLPKEVIRVREGTINMYAAVDIVEEKLKQALRKYKDLHHIGRKERHLLSRSHNNQQ